MLIISQWDCGTGRTHRNETRVVFSGKSVRGVGFIAMSRQPFGIACVAQGTLPNKPPLVGFWPIALFARAAAFSRDRHSANSMLLKRRVDGAVETMKASTTGRAFASTRTVTHHARGCRR